MSLWFACWALVQGMVTLTEHACANWYSSDRLHSCWPYFSARSLHCTKTELWEGVGQHLPLSSVLLHRLSGPWTMRTASNWFTGHTVRLRQVYGRREHSGIGRRLAPARRRCENLPFQISMGSFAEYLVCCCPTNGCMSMVLTSIVPGWSSRKSSRA